MKTKRVISALKKAGCVITKEAGKMRSKYKAVKNNHILHFNENNGDDTVSYLVSKSPHTDVDRDYFADTFYNTIKEAVAAVNEHCIGEGKEHALEVKSNVLK